MKGQEWRAIVSNYAEFYARAAGDWEKPSDRMRELAESPGGLPAEERWAPRARSACVFCARSYWTEELTPCFLAGAQCFMKSPARVVALLDWSVYHAQWPNIPADELQASAVNLRVGNTSSFALVLLHKRRVSEAQATGGAATFVCLGCRGAFGQFAITNHMWLGRQDPFIRDANLSHQWVWLWRVW